MPTIFDPKDFPVIEKNGANTATLANQAILGTNALQVQKVLLRPRADSASYSPSDTERFVYVIRGKGQAYVNERVFPLGAESVLWLEKSDTFYLEAGSEELEVLFCQAPASE
jgi:mannose-6-phosphate isomerase-like protein (cupin superfamily)